ncbi:autoinducer 2 ABC transporter substrate-binding protein LsrB [Oceanivirga salmonicida]|uniref:autoinducer 2 ABC transporter substrate-binding protein LsrB n=1 Tax=Oceanivirga salmonicida TaxID=1769291 RepID=UPI0012E2746D|nr:autoinducer 2 ABC transporter substrate-binding protein LsrB [Oceanivirga salmonicida]
MKKKLSLMLVITFIMTIFMACGKTEEVKNTDTKKASDVSIVFIPKLTGNMFFESANEGAKAMAKEVGYEYKYDGTTNATVADQVQVINSAINQGYNAIAVSSNSPDGLNEALKSAADSGLKIVTWDSDVNPEYRSLMVSQGTPEQLGEMLINMVADQIEDAENKKIKFAFFYSSPTVTDQNSWVEAAKKYVTKKYPKWELLTTEYGESDAQKSIQVGESILNTYPDIDAIICPDSTALPGMAQAAKNLGKNKKDLIITGFATPSSMRNFIKDGTIDRFGLWDCTVQGAMASYLAYYLAAGNTFKVGDKIEIPTVGQVEVMPNSVLGYDYLSDNSGIVLMPERTVFDINNIDDFNF